MALFPPIVASSMPAFDKKTGNVKIYFSFPNYSDITSVANVQVSVRFQNSNLNALQSPC